ncbi:MAG: EutN/CcmL family microcompartment protein [Candidatus Sericytochromatia bacterium]|nr:EutN/CcmL family microcompartment protein [Candidatus Sericytochromatia bacterium]
MRLGRVLGTVVATVKHPTLQGRKMIDVQPEDPFGKPVGEPVVALDSLQAGPGDLVLLMEEGGSSRQILQIGEAPIRCVVAGIVDHVELAPSASPL